jgi:sodium-dependent dicarboxylate transporter 2/3/5
MTLGVPAALALVPVGWLLLLRVYPPEIKTLGLKPERIAKEISEMGGFSRKEGITLVVFLLVIVFWIFGDLVKHVTNGTVDLPMEWVALVGGLLLFSPGTEIMTWRQAEKTIPWDAIVLTMASMALGLMMYETGAARWLAFVMLGKVGSLNPMVRFGVIILVVMLLKLFLASNTVTGTIIGPLLISLAQDFQMNPWILLAPGAFTSSLGIVLITQTPTNIIPYSAGYYSIREFAKAGSIMSVVIILMLTAVISVLGPITGLYAFTSS